MSRHTLKALTARAGLWLAIAVFVLSEGLLPAPPTAALQLQNRQLQQSANGAGQTAQYTASFAIVTAGVIGSIQIEFCDNSPLFDDPCNPPSGMNVAGATLLDQQGETGFSVAPSSTANSLILNRAPAAAAAGPVAYTLGNIVNPGASGAYFARIQTFALIDAQGTATDSGGLALNLNNAVAVQTEVPPYLTFCVGITIGGFDCSLAQGDFIDLGDLDSLITSTGQTEMVTATNAESGYSIMVNGTTLTSGNNVLAAMQGGPALAGNSQFGLNAVANSSPLIGANPQGPGTGVAAAPYAQPNHFRFQDGEAIAAASGVQDFRKYTVSYVVNIAKGQAPGVYATTLTYICLANF